MDCRLIIVRLSHDSPRVATNYPSLVSVIKGIKWEKLSLAKWGYSQEFHHLIVELYCLLDPHRVVFQQCCADSRYKARVKVFLDQWPRSTSCSYFVSRPTIEGLRLICLLGLQRSHASFTSTISILSNRVCCRENVSNHSQRKIWRKAISVCVTTW